MQKINEELDIIVITKYKAKTALLRT